MSESLFIRLLINDNKEAALAEALAFLYNPSSLNSTTYTVNPNSFRKVPGSPFAYWVSDKIRQLFAELPPFESEGRTVRQGLATANDFRFVRTWWEVPSEKILTGTKETTPEEFRQQTFLDKRWVPFAKGGEYSPYYADLPLVVNWEQDGNPIKEAKLQDLKLGRITPNNSKCWNEGSYFRSGLTFPRRTKRFCPKALPGGAIFGHGGQSAFSLRHLEALIGIMGSSISQLSISLFLGSSLDAQGGMNPQFETGMIQKIPIPRIESDSLLKQLVSSSIQIKQNLDTVNETSHVFSLPAPIQVSSNTLRERLTSWQETVSKTDRQLADYQRQIDDISFQLYGIDEADRETIEAQFHSRDTDGTEERDESRRINDEEEDEEEGSLCSSCLRGESLLADLLSYTIGCIFGRWDIRFATGEKQAPGLPDPFAPLPVCSPGMLTGNDGLPLRETPSNYPLQIDWDGILVDDLDHPDDIIRRVRDVLEVIWSDKSEAIEKEACEILGIKDLRDYFRKPGNGGFWTDHIKRYSKSRRKAPIYWLLQSSKKNYALWIYYHRLDKDILFKSLINYVEPKRRLEESNLEQLRSQKAAAGNTGKAAKQLEKQIDRQEALVSELHDFEEKLRRAANLNLEPDLNDGVVLNIAPLWELVPWNEAKKYWQELTAGKYEWSSIGKQLKAKGVVKC